MKLTCIIVDDEPMARCLLAQYVDKLASLELLTTCSNSLEALEFLQQNQVDLLFLDVQMPELTGVSLLKILKQRPAVILTTAYSEYAVEGYSLDVADYLLKPITFDRFVAAVERVSQRLRTESRGFGLEPTASPNLASPANTRPAALPDELFVRDGNKSVRVAYEDIQYIEGLKDYVRIHTPSRKVTTLQSLKHLVEFLPSDRFVRIHNSTIIGVRWLEEVHRDEVRVAGTMLTVSDTYRAALRDFVAGREP